MRSKINLKNTFPSSLFSSQLYLLPHQPHRETGNGSYGQFITHCSCCCSGRGVLPLLQCGVPPMRDSSPWTSPKWIYPTGNSFPQAAATRVTLPSVAALQAQPAPAWVPYGVTSPTRRPSLHGSAGPYQAPAPAQASHGFSALFQTYICSSLGCRGTACFTSPWSARESQLQHLEQLLPLLLNWPWSSSNMGEASSSISQKSLL